MAILRWFGVEWRLRPLMMHELQQEEGALRRHPCKTSRHSASPSVTAEQSFAFILAALKRGHRSIGSSPWQYPTLKQMVIIKITPSLRFLVCIRPHWAQRCYRAVIQLFSHWAFILCFLLTGPNWKYISIMRKQGGMERPSLFIALAQGGRLLVLQKCLCTGNTSRDWPNWRALEAWEQIVGLITLFPAQQCLHWGNNGLLNEHWPNQKAVPLSPSKDANLLLSCKSWGHPRGAGPCPPKKCLPWT